MGVAERADSSGSLEAVTTNSGRKARHRERPTASSRHRVLCRRKSKQPKTRLVGHLFCAAGWAEALPCFPVVVDNVGDRSLKRAAERLMWFVAFPGFA